MTHQTGQAMKHRATDQAAVFDALGLRTGCVITSLMTVLFTFSVFQGQTAAFHLLSYAGDWLSADYIQERRT